MNDELIAKINELKEKRNAVILAHNYQRPEVQDIADFTGDSLGLSITASKTDAETIVFCGVLFMAETAAILSQQKTVLLPVIDAGCPMADMITAEELGKLKDKHPGSIVVTYVNSSAEVKAESDYCCTSSNAVEVVSSLDTDKPVIFVPDQHLGMHVQKNTKKDLILWPGYCPSHVVITEDEIKSQKQNHPDALVLAHPECTEAVKNIADQIQSTGQMLKFAANSTASEFIIATEIGIIHSLKKANPDKDFFPASERAVCANMKKITLEKVLFALEDNKNIIKLPKQISEKAKISLDRMVEVLPVK